MWCGGVVLCGVVWCGPTHYFVNRNLELRLGWAVEYHNSVKCSIARELGLGLPCPSGDQFVVNRVI